MNELNNQTKMYNEPSLQERSYAADNFVKRVNGTPEQVKALVTSLGRTAARNGVCLFKCPYEAGSEYADVWMTAHSKEVNKMGKAILTA